MDKQNDDIHFKEQKNSLNDYVNIERICIINIH